MKREPPTYSMRAGDFLYAWSDTGIGASPTIVQVVRVNRKTITIRNEAGEVIRANPALFRPWVEPGQYGVLTVPPQPEQEMARVRAELAHAREAIKYYKLWHPGPGAKMNSSEEG